MPYEWTDPELFLTHNGVNVYHTYKGGPGNEVRMSYWFTTDAGDCDVESGGEYTFDVRELPNPPPEIFDACYQRGGSTDALHREQIKCALERGILPLPPDNDGTAEPVESPVDKVVALLEGDGVEPEALDEIVHDLKSREASGINNGGLRDQVEYILESGISLDELQGMLAGSMKV